jgi:hypothetical protein
MEHGATIPLLIWRRAQTLFPSSDRALARFSVGQGWRCGTGWCYGNAFNE